MVRTWLGGAAEQREGARGAGAWKGARRGLGAPFKGLRKGRGKAGGEGMGRGTCAVASHDGQDGGGRYWPRRRGGEGTAAALLAALKAGSGGEGAEWPRALRRPAARAAWGRRRAAGGRGRA